MPNGADEAEALNLVAEPESPARGLERGRRGLVGREGDSAGEQCPRTLCY